MKRIDIVVPCFNEEDVLPVFIEETNRVLDSVSGYDFRYILVDDGSGDNTLAVMRTLAAQCARVKYISFSRNFGKEAAFFAGLEYADGDYVIVMDADLQHPPALIPQMIASIEKGHDCCAAYRNNRSGDGHIRSFFSKLFFRFSNSMTGTKMPYGAVDYRMMTRQMVDAVLSLKEDQRFSKGIFCWVGFDTEWIGYDDVQRTIGTTKWSFRGLLKYALTGILSFSTVPLQVISILGFFISFLAFGYGIVTVIQTLVLGIDVPGYATLLCVMLLLGGIIELSVGILGLYLSRIFAETKRRPVYIIKTENVRENDSRERDVSCDIYAEDR